MNPIIEWIVALAMIVSGITLIYLIRAVGKFKAYEINSIGGVLSFIYNPMNWLRLYRIFFHISGGQGSSNFKIASTLILNLLALCCMVLMLAYMIPKQY